MSTPSPTPASASFSLDESEEAPPPTSNETGFALTLGLLGIIGAMSLVSCGMSYRRRRYLARHPIPPTRAEVISDDDADLESLPAASVQLVDVIVAHEVSCCPEDDDDNAGGGAVVVARVLDLSLFEDEDPVARVLRQPR